MNDFTKEELEDLYAAMRIIDNLAYDLPSDKDAYRLKEKIESMIDNYCEHKCDHEFKLCLNYRGIDEHQYRCKKCLKTYDELNAN